MKTITISILCMIYLFGCASRLETFTVEDKRESMLGEKDTRFTVKSNRASSIGNTVEVIAPTRGYIKYNTATVLNGDNLSKYDFIQRPVNGPILTHHLTMKALDESAYEGTVQGHAALISRDGYFLTAAHVIENENSLIIYNAMDYVESEGETVDRKYLILPVRKVFVDDASDFAIVKTELDSLFNFALFKERPKKGERLYSGGWFRHGPSSGILSSGPEKLREEPLIQEFSTTIPVVHGDSGSGVFNNEGKLLGVVTSVSGDYSFFSMMETDHLNSIIQEDRNAYAEKATISPRR